MIAWFRRLPLTVRLPLLVAALIFAAALVTTQVFIFGLSVQFERQMAQMAEVYLDGLAAALLPPALRDDQAEVQQVLDRAFGMQVGVVERRLVCLDSSGAVIAQADRRARPPGPRSPAAWATVPRGIYFDRNDASLWVWRKLPAGGESLAESATMTVVANLDLSKFISERSRLQWSLTSLDLFISGLCALFGFALARQLQRPVTLLAEHLEHVAAGGSRPVPSGQIPTGDRETTKLVEAFNRMASEAQERELMLEQIAEQERVAVLGRMAATLAHEVRNPLGGVLTALATLRKFGDDAPSREESIDFMERGLLTIQEVADAALKTHRPVSAARSFSEDDLLDVQRLAESEARQQGVSIEVDAQLPDVVSVSATEVRQILLNLLLNATRATSHGGSVMLRGRIVEHELLLEVIDRGTGLSPELARGLEDGQVPAGHDGLGVDVIVRLMERLQGRVSVQAGSTGTHIALYLPLAQDLVTTHG